MKKILLFTAVLLTLGACDNNDDNPTPSSEVAATVTATIGESALTRAGDDSWAKDDKIGISSTVGSVVGPYINLEYITIDGDGNFTGKTPLFFYKPMTLTAYYPYSGTEGTAPGENGNGVIKAETTVDNQTADKQPKIDFLWDSKTGVDNKDFSAAEPNVNFNFTHRMSKLSFIFQSSEPVYDENNNNQMVSDGVDTRTMVSYEIRGLGIKGTFNTATGECTLDENEKTNRQGFKMEFKTEPINEVNKYKYKREFKPLIVFPQEKPDEGFILYITTEEEKNNQTFLQDYKCSLGFTDNEIKPGYHYKYKIQVTRRGLIVGAMTIEPWAGSQKYIVATIDGNEKPKEETPAENP